MSEEHPRYTCDRCGKKFFSEWSQEESRAESQELWGKDDRDEGMSIVCDDCFQIIMRAHKQ